jgi:hypothetical protein
MASLSLLTLLQVPSVDLLTKLTDNMLTLGILGMGVWVMWKRDQRYRDKQDQKLDALEKKLEQYIQEDHKVMLEHIERATDAHVENTSMLKQTNRILGCFTEEMMEFKGSELYTEYLKTKKR